MNAIEHLLATLAEESAEVAQDAGKSLRFGLDDRNALEPSGPTNRERLINELNDLIAVAGMLVDFGVLPATWLDGNKILGKKRKVRHWMNHAMKVGALVPDSIADLPRNQEPKPQDRKCQR